MKTVKSQICNKGQNTNNVKTVRTQKLENYQNAKKKVKTVKTQKCERGLNTKMRKWSNVICDNGQKR